VANGHWRNSIMSSRTSTSSHTENLETDEEKWSTIPTPQNDEENALPSEKKNEEGKDPNIVDWDGEDDKLNPRNWSTLYKSWITFQLGMLALAASLGSSIIAPVENDISEYVGVSREVTVLVISLYM